jgi:hypothetical protein
VLLESEYYTHHRAEEELLAETIYVGTLQDHPFGVQCFMVDEGDDVAT